MAERRRPEKSAEAYILESIVDPAAYRVPGSTGQMPANLGQHLSDEQLLDLTAFLASQGSQVDYVGLLRLGEQLSKYTSHSTTTFQLESIERGRELFFGKLKCNVCHHIDWTPGHNLLAPNLAQIGHHEREYLRESILDPSRHIVQTYEQGIVIDNGRLVSGRRLAATKDQIRLIVPDDSGDYQVEEFELEELEPFGAEDEEEYIQMSGTSAMPAYQELVTAEELESLLDFLQAMR